MRILAIRGQNLASLAGKFAIELDAPPFAGAGLFAITGPTGAGKSTILDAACLALFDRTPRLTDRGGIPIGRGADKKEKLLSNDVRSILRRGAPEGYAEVEFLGVDGRRYRARWSVARAHRRAEGRVQSQVLELRDLATGRVLGGTKTETLAAAAERLGLSFDQFRRSVLLAQGEFAAFLQAKADERSELLERMTGTEIYGRISQVSYERSKRERESLEAIERRAGEVPLLDADARGALEARLRAREGDLAAARAAHGAAEQALAWFERLAALEREVAEARGRLAEAEAALAAAGGERRELEATRAAEAHRSAVAAVDLVAAEAGKAREEAAKRAREATSAGEERERAAKALAGAEERLDQAARAIEAAAPAIEAARALDACVAQAADRAGAARAEARESRARAAEAAAERERLAKEREALAARKAKASDWLEAHAALRPLAIEWTRWREDLRRYGDAARERRSAEDRRLAAAGEESAARRGLAKAVRAAEEAAEALSIADGACALAKRAVEEMPSAPARAERERIEEEHGRAQALARAGDDARAAHADAGHERACEEGARAAAERAAGEAAAAIAERGKVGAALAEAEAAHRSLRAALDLAAHRAELEEGKPCPLCGSEAHPWARGEPAFDRLEREAAGRVATLREAGGGLERDRAAAEARRVEQERAAAQARRRLAKIEARLGEAAARWLEARERLPAAAAPESPIDPAAEAAVRALLAEGARRLEEAREREKEALRRAAAFEKARDERDARRRAKDEAEAKSRGAEKARDEAAAALAALDADIARHAAACEASARALAEPFAGRKGWLEDLEADPPAFEKRAWREAADYARLEKDLEGAEKAIAALEPALEAAARLAGETAADAERREIAAEATEAEAAGLRTERASLLGGKPVADFERALRAEEAAARRSRDEAAAEAGRRAASASAAEALAGQAAVERAAREAAHERSRDDLRRALDAAGLEEAGVRARLARGPAWIEEQAARMAKGERALAEARAVLADRAGKRDEHAAKDRPEATMEESRAARDAARDAMDRADEAVRAARVEIRSDDENRERLAGISAEIEKQRQVADLWSTLSDLIGSADGKRFRTFAQSLTLDVLLGHANLRLAELTPRYRLERVPGTDLDLEVIDRDMADEVRGIQSLSGGESFLVSLALALGLSSLAAERTSIESLFVDEGFGSLDGDTLEAAMATLDALQASGCTVGLISHVSGLAERIGVQVKVQKRGGGRSEVVVARGRSHPALPVPCTGAEARVR